MSTFVIQGLKQELFLSFFSWQIDLKGLVDLVSIGRQLSPEGIFNMHVSLLLKIVMGQSEHDSGSDAE